MTSTQIFPSKAEIRAEMRSLSISPRRLSLPLMIAGLLAVVNTASAITTLACL